VTIVERVSPGSEPEYGFESGEPPGLRHLRALQWLLDEHPRSTRAPGSAPYEGRVVLEIARTALPGGRVGHAYALNAGPLGAPSGDAARGIVWRLIETELGG
jgi:hypothetical protein